MPLKYYLHYLNRCRYFSELVNFVYIHLILKIIPECDKAEGEVLRLDLGEVLRLDRVEVLQLDRAELMYLKLNLYYINV